MLCRSLPGTAVRLGVALAVTMVAPQTLAGSDDGYEGIDGGRALDVHGMMDVYGETNLSAIGARALAMRAFDDHADTPSLGFAGLTLARAPKLFGFRLDVGAGNVPDAFLGYDPDRLAHPGLARGLSYVTQAFVTVVAPLPHPLAIDVGKFGTPVGYEDNESLTAWNYSRGLLFTLAEPTYHTGVRAKVDAAPWLTVATLWMNGWNTNVLGGNGMRGFGLSITVTPGERCDLGAQLVGGPERAPTRLSDPTTTFREMAAFAASCRLTERVSVVATADVAHDAYGDGVMWWGVGAYVRARLLPWLAANARAEHYEDPSGFVTGVAQAITEGTGTLEGTYQIGPFSSVGRLEYRRDQSGARPFGGLTHDDTLSASVMVAF